MTFIHIELFPWDKIMLEGILNVKKQPIWAL